MLTWNGSFWVSTTSNSHLPVVVTILATNITTSATTGGDITSDGGYSIIAKGVC